MTFHCHVRCNRCEEILFADSEDESLTKGWLIVRCGDPDDDSLDFCSRECVAQWALDPVEVGRSDDPRDTALDA